MLPEAVKSPKAASELNGFAQGWPAIVRLGGILSSAIDIAGWRCIG